MKELTITIKENNIYVLKVTAYRRPHDPEIARNHRMMIDYYQRTLREGQTLYVNGKPHQKEKKENGKDDQIK
tara:strand:+ start:126 stop:341 length:216 start_codon:yes stop_codon:yes gene_type:complete